MLYSYQPSYIWWSYWRCNRFKVYVAFVAQTLSYVRHHQSYLHVSGCKRVIIIGCLVTFSSEVYTRTLNDQSDIQRSNYHTSLYTYKLYDDRFPIAVIEWILKSLQDQNTHQCHFTDHVFIFDHILQLDKVRHTVCVVWWYFINISLMDNWEIRGKYMA